jgi:hypothetical protein
MHVPPTQSPLPEQLVRHSSPTQTSGEGHTCTSQWFSTSSEHAPPSGIAMQREPMGQSREERHAAWQLPNEHTSGDGQSDARVHGVPGVGVA